MSEHSSFPLFVTHNLKTRPQDFIIPDDIGQRCSEVAKKARAADVAANPPTPEQAKVQLKSELNMLRKQLFELQQTAKSTEQKVNNEAGNVHLLEGRITTTIKEQKEYETSGNLIASRSYEHQIQQLENELADTRERLVKNQSYNAGAARQLRTWQTEKGPRLKELQKEVA
jgi:uncharacterized membrane-anchored protein YjiN (DUF445 family)